MSRNIKNCVFLCARTNHHRCVQSHTHGTHRQVLYVCVCCRWARAGVKVSNGHNSFNSYKTGDFYNFNWFSTNKKVNQLNKNKDEQTRRNKRGQNARDWLLNEEAKIKRRKTSEKLMFNNAMRYKTHILRLNERKKRNAASTNITLKFLIFSRFNFCCGFISFLGFWRMRVKMETCFQSHARTTTSRFN